MTVHDPFFVTFTRCCIVKQNDRINDRINGRLESIQKDNSLKELAEQFKYMDTSLQAFKDDLSVRKIREGRFTPDRYKGVTNTSFENGQPRREVSYHSNHNQTFAGVQLPVGGAATMYSCPPPSLSCQMNPMIANGGRMIESSSFV